MLDRIERCRFQYQKWREGFAGCHDSLAKVICGAFNQLPEPGCLSGYSKGAGKPGQAFRKGAGSDFVPHDFDRFCGNACGHLTETDLGPGSRVAESVLYSVWEETQQSPRGQFQRITGSRTSCCHPQDLRETTRDGIDITLNFYRHDLGIISWVTALDRAHPDMTAAAYRIDDDTIIWMTQLVNTDEHATADDVFFATVEWSWTGQGASKIYMAGLNFSIDFKRCRTQLVGSTIWNALYTEIF